MVNRAGRGLFCSLCACEASSGVLCPGLGTQYKKDAKLSECAEEGHKDDQRIEEPLLEGTLRELGLCSLEKEGNQEED